MQKNIYIILCVAAIGLTGYTFYYTMSNVAQPAPITITDPTPIATTTPVVEDPNTYTTKSGKKIKLVETNPAGESLSTVTITPTGFATNSPIILELNKLTNSSYADLNNDGYEELIITTVAQGSGSFGEVFIYTTASDTQLLPVTIPEMSEEDTKKGGLFEGYMGHDSFMLVNGKLSREFPTYAKTDTNNEPTGPRKTVLYTLTEKNGSYSITFSKETSSTTPASASSTTAKP
jgi:hypothetical protein